MTTHTQSQAPAATHGAFALAGPIAVAAAVAVLAALWVLAKVLLALPQAGAFDTRPFLHELAIPSAQAGGVPTAATTVPEASQVFAGRETVVEDPAPTF